jgi:hypothetical protein
MHFWDIPPIAICSWETKFDESNKVAKEFCAILYLSLRMWFVHPPIEGHLYDFNETVQYVAINFWPSWV